MLVEKNAPLQQYNTFGIMARAMNLVRVQSEQDIREFLAGPPLGASRQVVVLGGGLSGLPALYEELPKRLPGHLLPGVALPAIRQARFGGAGGVRGAALLNL